MSRADRAQCRILFHRAHIPLTRLAEQYNRSEDYIKRVLQNNAGKKAADDVDEDYDHVDEETKAQYPPLVSTYTYPFSEFPSGCQLRLISIICPAPANEAQAQAEPGVHV